MKPNIGILNALVRITCGLTVLSWATARMVKYQKNDSYIMIAMLGAMKVGEGITRFCPITELFMRYQTKAEDKRAEQAVVNPT